MSEAIVVEHTHGLSVSTPHCDKCGKFCDQMRHNIYFYATGGVHFNDLSFRCSECSNTIMVPHEQVELLNRYTEPSAESYNKIVWQSPPNLRIKHRSETFFPT